MDSTNTKVLLLQDSYFPNTNANTVCASYVAKKLNQKDIPIDFYIYKRHKDEIDKQDGKNKVFYITSKYRKLLYRFGKRDVTIGTLKKEKRLFTLAKAWMLWMFKDKIDIHSDTVNIKEVLKKIKIEHEIQPYTHMLNICYPFGSMRIAQRIKKEFPEIKWIFYMLDPYEYNYALKKKKINKRKHQFAKYTKGLDKLILTRGIDAEHKRQCYDNGHKDITVEVDLPNLINPISGNLKTVKNNDSIIFLYAGLFYKDIRNPDKMLELFSKIENKNIVFNVLGRACEYLTSNYGNLDPRIILHGVKPHTEVQTYLEQANILINVGNTIPNQVPSKVFEYIATGKPIINFYFNEFDTSLFYLNKYPLCFNINVNQYTAEDIVNLNVFINENKNNILTFEQATNNLQDCLSNNVCEKIASAILD